jgi:hypothetical protein
MTHPARPPSLRVQNPFYLNKFKTLSLSLLLSQSLLSSQSNLSSFVSAKEDEDKSRLTKLEFSYGELSPPFDPSHTEYMLAVPHCDYSHHKYHLLQLDVEAEASYGAQIKLKMNEFEEVRGMEELKLKLIVVNATKDCMQLLINSKIFPFP